MSSSEKADAVYLVVERGGGSRETTVTTYNAFDPKFTTSLGDLSNANLTLNSHPTTRIWRVAIDVDNQLMWLWNPFFGSWNIDTPVFQNPGTAGGWTFLACTGYTPGTPIYPTFWVNLDPDSSGPHVPTATSITLNAGASNFNYDIPSGFVSLNDAVGTTVTFDPVSLGSHVLLSDANMTAIANGTDFDAMTGLGVRTNAAVPSGKFYYEFSINAIGFSGTYNHLAIVVGSGPMVGIFTDYPGVVGNGDYRNLSGIPSPPFGFGFAFQIDGQYPGDAMRTSLTVQGKSTGKFYWEITATNLDTHNSDASPRGGVGLASHLQILCAPSTGGGGILGRYNVPATGTDEEGIGFFSDGIVLYNNGGAGTGGTWHTGTTLGIAADLDAKLIWFWNPEIGKWNNDAAQDPGTGVGGISFSGMTYPAYPAASVAFWAPGGVPEDVLTGNWGQSPFVYTPPDGFGKWGVTTTVGRNGYLIERMDNRIWPTVEDAWCVDCGFTLARPTPVADLTVDSATGAGIPTGISGLVGGQNYSTATTVQVIDDNGQGPGSGAIATPTITGGVVVGIALSGGGNYIYPQLVFNDPENTGSGASATITLDNSATFTASAAVFAPGDVGSVIRCGYGVADITAFTDTTHVIANIRSPIAQIQTDNPLGTNTPIKFVNGTWTMTVPISSFYLPQMVGFEITGLADGQIIPPTLVPDNGIVTLAQPASAIIVGLAFQAQLQSTYLDAGEPTVQAQRKKIAEVTVRVEESAAFQIGGNQPDGSVQNPHQLAPLWQNMVDAPTHAVAPFGSTALPLFTGDIRVPIGSGFNTRGQVAVQQLNPLPLQVLDYVPEVLAGDKPAQEAPQRQRGKGGGQGQQ